MQAPLHPLSILLIAIIVPAVCVCFHFSGGRFVGDVRQHHNKTIGIFTYFPRGQGDGPGWIWSTFNAGDISQRIFHFPRAVNSEAGDLLDKLNQF